MTFRPLVFLLAVCCLTFIGSGKRGAAVLLSVHLETSQDRYPKLAEAVKVGDSSNQYYFDRMPLFTDDNVDWYFPFLAEDGATYGAAFRLDIRASDILQITSRSPENRGKLLAVNVQPLSDKQLPLRSFLEVDKPINDGVFVIWKGLTDAHLKEFSKRFPHARDVVPSQPVPAPQ